MINSPRDANMLRIFSWNLLLLSLRGDQRRFIRELPVNQKLSALVQSQLALPKSLSSLRKAPTRPASPASSSLDQLARTSGVGARFLEPSGHATSND